MWLKGKQFFLFCKSSDADLIFLQETHSDAADLKFWKTQWGNTIFASHGSSHSAGVLTLIHKFKGDILKVVESNDGRWITTVIKQDNSFYAIFMGLILMPLIRFFLLKFLLKSKNYLLNIKVLMLF